jgi:hypothetical protein
MITLVSFGFMLGAPAPHQMDTLCIPWPLSRDARELPDPIGPPPYFSQAFAEPPFSTKERIKDLFEKASGYVPSGLRAPSQVSRIFDCLMKLEKGQTIGRPVFLDILRASALPGPQGASIGQRLHRYSLEVVSTSIHTGCGYDRRWSDPEKGNAPFRWELYLDNTFGIALLYDGLPNAVVSFDPLLGHPDGNSPHEPLRSEQEARRAPLILRIEQLQGVRPIIEAATTPLRRTGNSWGLCGLDWTAALVRIAERIAIGCGFDILSIQCARHNRWTHSPDGVREPALAWNKALATYDETAKRLGFTQKAGGDWYRPLG